MRYALFLLAAILLLGCTQAEESYGNNAFKARLLVYPLG